jgi:hypothetical protein
MWGDSRLVWLVVAHPVLWLLSVVLAPVNGHPPTGLQHCFIVSLLAVTFSQITLLGIWAVLLPLWSWYRLLGLVIGTARLEAGLDFATGAEFLLMPSVAMALTVVSLLVVRGSIPDEVLPCPLRGAADPVAGCLSRPTAVSIASTRSWSACDLSTVPGKRGEDR